MAERKMRRDPQGICFGDWEIGKEYWSMERTLTETDLVHMEWLSGDRADGPMYSDDGKGNKVAYIHGALTDIVSNGLITATHVFDGCYVAHLGGSIRFTKAVLVGDTIRAALIPVSKRASKSRPGTGIVSFEIKVYNQRDEVVCTKETQMMIADSYEIAQQYTLTTL